MAEADWRTLATQVAAGHGPWRLPDHAPTRPEQLLALTARTRLTDAEATHARALGQQLSELEWHAVMALSSAGYLATLVYAQIAALEMLSLLPPAVYAFFAEHYRVTLLTNLRIRTALERLLDQLATARIPAVPLKGVVLAERVYGNIAWRPTRDIDLLVRREDIPRIAHRLRQSGYAPEDGQEHIHAFAAISTTETKYERKDSPLVELHWGMSKRPAYRLALAIEGVWARVLTEDWHGRAIHVLAPGDELRYLAVHCTADHPNSQLNWLADIAELVRGLPADWPWDAFVAETVAAELAAPVGLALAQCRAVLGLDLPDAALADLLRAGLAPGERVAWQSAWAKRLSRAWIASHLQAIPSRPERALFTMGALARIAANTTSKRLSRPIR